MLGTSKELSGQQFSVLDIIYRPAYETLGVVQRLAQSQIEAIAMQEVPGSTIPVDERKNCGVLVAQRAQLTGGDRRLLRFISGSGQNQGIGGPLDGALCLIRGVADVPGFQPLDGGLVQSVGVGENFSYPVSCYHLPPLSWYLLSWPGTISTASECCCRMTDSSMVSSNALAICIIAAHPLSSLTTLSDPAQPRLKPALSLSPSS